MLLAGNGWILDVVFFLLLILGVFSGVKKGFLLGVSKLAGTILALAVALVFAASFEVFLENVFHMTTAIANGLVGAMSGNEMLAAEISGANLTEALTAAGIPAFLANAIADAVGSGGLPEGTTAAMLLGPLLAKWIAIAISFVLLLILVKLGVSILSHALTGAVESVKPLAVINQLLGGVLGLAKTALLIFVLLAICSWLPLQGVHEYITSSAVVGALFDSAWFADATSYVFSFRWLTDFLNSQLAAL